MNEDVKVTLPKLGESILTATIVQWFKQEGEEIKRDEPLLEVSTDKVNSEIPSPVTGVVKRILASPDEELNVGDPLAIIESGASLPVKEQDISALEKKPPPPAASSAMKNFFSPALLNAAREKGISLEQLEKIPGSGEGGRLTKKDLETFLETSRGAPCPLPSKKTVPEGASRGSHEEIERVKMSGMRKAIADNMVRSFYEAPHATLVTEVDMTSVLKTIQQCKEEFLSLHGVKLTLTSFAARAVAKALKEYPLINSSLEQETILVKRFVNLGIAVSVDQGIMVPVIRHCEEKSLSSLAKAIADLSAKARAGKLSAEEIGGGTISLTNFGMSGVAMGVPIIRYPEVAILGLGAIQKKVVVLEGDLLAIRSLMHVSLTFDHRVLDGMYGCGFLASLKAHLEQDVSVN